MQFHFTRIPEIIFESGAFGKLHDHIKRFGSNVLMILDPIPLKFSGNIDLLLNNLKAASIKFHISEVSGEPSPELIDKIVAGLKRQNIDVVTS